MMASARRNGRWWLLGYLAPEWPALAAGSVAMAARAGVLLLIPWPLKFIVDNVIFEHPLHGWARQILPDPALHRMELLNVVGLVLLGLGIVDALLVYVGNRLFLRTGQRVVFAIATDMFAHLQRLSLEFHRRNRGGELMSRLTADVRQLQDFVASIGIDLLPHALTIAGLATVMLLLDWRYALIALGVAPILFLIARHYGGRIRRALRQVRGHEGTLAGVAQETLANIHLVQSFGREEYEDRRFVRQANLCLDASLGASALQARFTPTMNLALAVATGAIVWYGAVSVIHGTLSAGELLVFLAYLRGIATPARQLAKTGPIIGRAAVALERIGEYRAERPSVIDRPGLSAPATCAGRVSFRSVGFGYQSQHPMLHDISFELEPGKTVALVGPTGSGKSTIASLIPRFYDPWTGQVLLDQHDLRDLPLSFLRRQVALVLQEPVLFQATIWENIAYGRDGAGREDAVNAARMVGVEDVIARIPGGYDAMVSERGLSLSGGQRQCVAVARAMLSDAKIVILDEPSSSLDSVTEQRLMAALARLAADRAALVIAHRLSTVMTADLILVLDRGRIVQRGTHAELIGAGGAYASLWLALGDKGDSPKLRAVA